ncbi:MAG: branched-chain amino acid ABC transporter permease, partial [Thermomicrobiaceae bacterium]|nr:branched-chain amino acid ABC transporter permease [Thermomicrobiaceae bacterium]
MTLLAQTIANGLLIGGLYVALSIGFALAFGVLDVIDFAVGEWVMLGGFAGYFLWKWAGVDPFVLLPVVFVVFGAAGYLGAPRHKPVGCDIYARPALMALAFTFGIALIMRGGALTLWGFNTRSIAAGLGGLSVQFGPVSLPGLRLVSFAFALIAVALFLLVLYRTRFGLAVRAVAQNKQYASLMGVDVERVSAHVYALYAALTGMVGVLMAAIYSVTPEVGIRYTLFAFFVVVLAGLGSITGVLVAGLFLGLLEALVAVYVGGNYTFLVVFAVLYLVLVVSPQGIHR